MDKLLCSLFCIYSSYNVIYSLPSMLDIKSQNNNLTIHNFFGEATSQLVSLVLLSEAYNIISKNINNDKLKMELYAILNNQLGEYRNKSFLLRNLQNIKKSDISKDLNNIHYLFFKSVIIFTYIIVGKKINYSSDNLIYNLYKIYFTDNYICRTKNMTNMDSEKSQKLRPRTNPKINMTT